MPVCPLPVAKSKRLHMEACGDTLIYYGSMVRIKPLEVRRFIEDGLIMLSLFHLDA